MSPVSLVFYTSTIKMTAFSNSTQKSDIGVGVGVGLVKNFKS